MSLLVIIDDWVPREWDLALTDIERMIGVRIWPDVGEPAAIRYALAWKPPAGALADFPNLRAIFSLGAGVDHLLGDPALPDVPIIRFIDPALTQHMSEYIAQQVLMHHRRQLDYEAQRRERIWCGLPQPLASEVRVGVMGLGILGSAVVRTLGALGFDLAGWSRSPHALPNVASFAGEAELAPFLARTDILVCLLPLTEATRGILDRALLRQLARDGALPGPVLINAGRGALHKEADILAALDSGELWGASLDVFEREPLPQDSPLWDHPRVFITPHNAAISVPRAIAAYITRQIERLEIGEVPENVVDRARGY